MTTQRDRLAAVLNETFLESLDNKWTYDEWADALLARGARVVDVETLAAALDGHECVGEWSICDGKCAPSVLEALDS